VRHSVALVDPPCFLLTRSLILNRFYTVFVSVVFGAMHAGTMLIYAGDITKAKSNAKAVVGLMARAAAAAPKGPRLSPKQPVQGRIIFSNVQFAYPSRPDQLVLKGIDIVVEPGQSVAFVGESGSGKSTLTALLYRFYNPAAGESLPWVPLCVIHGRLIHCTLCIGKITLDGLDVTQLDVDEYRSQMAFVQQEPILYDGTIRFNIELGCDEPPSEDEVVQACEEAGMWPFIQSLPHGLDTDLGAKGLALSGGCVWSSLCLTA
jgi:ATP-binding cassette subfamily B (MDR/TAP) protein 1